MGRKLTTGKYKTREALIDAVYFYYYRTAQKHSQVAKTCGVSEPVVNSIICNTKQKKNWGGLTQEQKDMWKTTNMTISDTLDAREKSYGSYPENCKLTQDVKDILRAHHGWDSMSPEAKQSVEMIIYKIARIITGDHGHKDSWHDIGGFALLIEQDIPD